jgi:cytoskeletal protein RodZ
MTRRRRQLLNSAEDLRQPRDLDNIAHFEPRRETVGDLLRRAREGKSQALEAVATRLRIRVLYLKAIEDGRFQDLPGLTYAVGFVRTYADHLGLDAEDVVRRFRDEVTELKSQTQLIFPVVAAEGKIPRGAILLLSAVLAAIAYGGWYYLSEREQSALDLIPELPAKLKALVSGEEPVAPEAAPAAPPAAVAETAPAPVAGEAAPAEGAAAPGTTPATTDTAAAPVPDESLIAVAPAPEPVAEPAPPAVPVPAPDAASDPVAESAAAASALPSVSAPGADALAEDESAAEAALLSQTPPATGTAPAIAAPEVSPPAPGIPAAPDSAPAAPTAPSLDASGLPTVAAPAAPATGNLAGLAPATDAAGLPAITDGQAFGATEGPSRIVLVARLESWVQVTDPETNALLTRVLRAGDRFYVPDQAGLSLATGNAGGIDIWVDGRKAPVLGPVGVVRRGVALDPQRLVDGTAVSDSPAVSE